MSSLSFFLVRLAKRRRHTPPSFLASRGFAAQGSRARALPLLNLKKKRDCSQSMSLRALFSISPAAIGITKIIMKNAYAKFWRDDKKYYGIFSNNAFSQLFQSIVYRSCFFGNEIICT